MVLMTTSDLPLRRIARGKVRDVYEVDADRLLLVATDRVSAYDVVMAEPIPMKGAVLTQVSAWWFRQLEGAVKHHMIAADADAIIAAVPALKAHRDEIAGRAMLCRRGTVFPIECVIRGYLSGSAWREYKASQTLAGEKMPDGLSESIRLDTPIFSPATKAESGHDENITVGRMREVLGAEVTAELERLTRIVYGRGRDVALKQGIIIADTKFEFGRTKGGEILLIDGLRPEIRTTRYTGLLLATATAVVFGCGFFLGRSLQQPAAAERSPQIDVVKQQQPTEKPLPPQAAQPPQSLTGRIQIQRNGKQQPDSGALVILLPLKNPTRLRFDGSALHTEKDNPARLATIAALSQLHAHFDQAADDGSFSLHYDTQTPAALLVISRHLAGPPGNPLPADCELLINQWFESTAGLTGRLATKLHPLPADQPLTPVSLTFQDATP